MLAWQMVFVLFMSSQLCLCSVRKSVWAERHTEGVQAPYTGKLWSMWRQKQLQASWDRQEIHRIKMTAWISCTDTAEMGMAQSGKPHKTWRHPFRDRRTEFVQWLKKVFSWLEAINCLQGQREYWIAVYKHCDAVPSFSTVLSSI